LFATRSTLMSILMQHKSELEFLNMTFSFLQRRTKYFNPESPKAWGNFQSLIEVLQEQQRQVLVADACCYVRC
jgi:hypothetical protein